MVRTVGNNMRAFLSDKYRILDSYDLLDAVLPTLIENSFTVISSEVTERRLYLRAVTEKITSDIKQGDPVQYGITISTSDVGAGSLRVEPMVYRLVCLNGLITENTLKQMHATRRQGGDDIYELLSDRTKDLSDAAFWATVRDCVIASMKPERFERSVNVLREAANEQIKNFDIPEVVELTMRSIGLTGEKTKNSIVANLANGAHGAGLTRYGLINAITYAAQSDDVSYDDSIDMERAANEVLTLPKKQWDRIALSTPSVASNAYTQA